MHLRNPVIAVALLCKPSLATTDNHESHGTYKHVAFFSIDGMHSSDVPKWLAMKPQSTIAKLLETGYWYKGALTSAPSDSFPGTVNLVSGANPAVSGIWYDDAYGIYLSGDPYDRQTTANTGSRLDRQLWNPFSQTKSNCQGLPGSEGLYILPRFTRL